MSSTRNAEFYPFAVPVPRGLKNLKEKKMFFLTNFHTSAERRKIANMVILVHARFMTADN